MNFTSRDDLVVLRVVLDQNVLSDYLTNVHKFESKAAASGLTCPSSSFPVFNIKTNEYSTYLGTYYCVRISLYLNLSSLLLVITTF